MDDSDDVISQQDHHNNNNDNHNDTLISDNNHNHNHNDLSGTSGTSGNSINNSNSSAQQSKLGELASKLDFLDGELRRRWVCSCAWSTHLHDCLHIFNMCSDHTVSTLTATASLTGALPSLISNKQ